MHQFNRVVGAMVLLLLGKRADLLAQQAMPLDVVGRVAVAADAVPRTIAEAEAQARQSMTATTADTLPYQGVAFTRGGSERRCVDLGHASDDSAAFVRSADFVVGGFNRYAQLWYDGVGKLAWWPVNGSSMSPPRMTLAVSRLDGDPSQRIYQVALSRGRYYMYPADIRLPGPGRWLIVGRAGGNWGCYVFELS